MKPIISLTILFFFWLPFSTEAQTGYYVSDGKGNLVHHPNGDPNLVKADEWQIHLYTCSGDNHRWGTITGKSAQEVLNELKRSQQFDLKFARWGYGDEARVYSERLCSFKPVGPIAVIRNKTMSTPLKDELAELLRFYDEYRDLRDNLDKTFAMIEDNTTQSQINPMSSAGSKIMEYFGNYREAGKQLGRLQTIFDNLETASSQKFDELFDKLQDSFDGLKEQSNDLKNSLSQVNASNDGNNSWHFSKSWPYKEGGAKTWTTNLKIRGKSIVEVFNRKLVGSKRDDFNITDEKVFEFTEHIPALIKDGFDSEALQRQRLLYKEDDTQQADYPYHVTFGIGTVKVKNKSWDGKISEYESGSINFTTKANRDDFFNKIVNILSADAKGQTKVSQDDLSGSTPNGIITDNKGNNTDLSKQQPSSNTKAKRTDDGLSDQPMSSSNPNKEKIDTGGAEVSQSSAQPLAEPSNQVLIAVSTTSQPFPARITYESPQIINYTTPDGAAGSINKSEIITILSPDGNRLDFKLASEVEEYLKKVQPVVDQWKMNISRTGNQSPTGDISTASPSLSIAELSTYSRQGIKKVDEFVHFLTIITDKKIDPDTKDKAIEEVAALFLPEARIEVTSVNRPGVRTYPIKEYLARLKLLPYSSAKISWNEVHYVKDLAQETDGNYYGVIAGSQKFEGYGSDGKSIQYSDITQKTVKVKLQSYQKSIEGQQQINWEILLGNIGIAVTN